MDDILVPRNSGYPREHAVPVHWESVLIICRVNFRGAVLFTGESTREQITQSLNLSNFLNKKFSLIIVQDKNLNLNNNGSN